MTITGAIDFFRTQWTSRFIDTITVTRLVSRGTLDLSTFDYSETTSQIYQGGALIRRVGDAARRLFGQETVVEGDYLLLVPHTATGLQRDDRVAVTASVKEPDLVGKTLIIAGVGIDSYNTRRAALCKLIQGQGET